MEKKIKVVWLCQVVNAKIKQRLNYGYPWIEQLLNRILGRKTKVSVEDYARWNTNAINEMHNNPTVELHVVSQFPYLRFKQQTYVENGITFHFFQAEDFTFFSRLKYMRNHDYTPSYKKNTRLIHKIIKDIDPDIIHLMGAENPNYGKSIISLKTSAKIIVQLQTLMIMPNFKEGYKISDNEYYNRTAIEKAIIKRADYVGTAAVAYIGYLKSLFEYKDKVFLNTSLALTEPVKRVNYKKEYDVVYFAANINKAADIAIEAFAKVQNKLSNASMVVIGGYDDDFKRQLDEFIQCHCINNISFTGKLSKYEDVIETVCKAKVALLPLKVDLISGTIRESMANGIPVVTTVTPNTPKLNLNRESILLSEVGDIDSLASNVIQLLSNPDIYNRLRINAFETASERNSNKKVVESWISVYKSCVKNNK